MSNKLIFFNQIYESILHSDLSDNEKSRKFARLMTDLEKEFNIPVIKDEEWERRNKLVVALYRKVSMSRSI